MVANGARKTGYARYGERKTRRGSKISYLRNQLRQATAKKHTRLDTAFGDLPLSSDRDYADFLLGQYRARKIVGTALAICPPFGIAAPPCQLASLSQDLVDLGNKIRGAESDLVFATPLVSLGAAWVLAGSSLGNRTIRTRRRKAGLRGPDRFLSDDSLARYFVELLAILDRSYTVVEVEQAIAGAHATFDVFAQSLRTQEREVAA